MKKVIIILLFLFGAQASKAQVQEDPRRYIDSAVYFLDLNQYVKADDYFMNALEKIDVLSADFCFHFGKNSYYMNKYAQSIDWLNKYLELKGSQGQYSKEAIQLLEAAETAFRESRSSNEKADVNSKFFYLNTAQCDEGEYVTCPVCRGDDVITTRDRLGEILYRTCPYSTNGVLSCVDFNLLIQGNLKKKNK